MYTIQNINSVVHFPSHLFNEELPDKEEFQNKFYVFFGSPWNSSEIEGTAALILTAIVRNGQWGPVTSHQIWDMVKNDHFSSLTEGPSDSIVNNLMFLAERGCLDLVKFADGHLLITPLQKFVDDTKQCKILLREATPIPQEKPEPPAEKNADDYNWVTGWFLPKVVYKNPRVYLWLVITLLVGLASEAIFPTGLTMITISLTGLAFLIWGVYGNYTWYKNILERNLDE